MLRAIAAAKKKNDRIDAGKIVDCLRCDFLPECGMAQWSANSSRFITFCFYVPSLEYPQTLSSSI